MFLQFIVSIIFTGLFTCPTAFGADSASEADKWLGRDRTKTFDEMVSQLKQFNIPSLRGLSRINTTWENELKKTKTRFIAAKTQEDVYYALLSLKNSMHDYHSKPLLDPNVRPQDKRAQLPVSLKPLFKDGVIQFVVEKSELKSIKPGFILKELDGKTPKDWEDYFLEWVNTTSPDYIHMLVAKWLTVRESDDLPLPLPGAEAHLIFFDPKTKGEEKVDLLWVFGEMGPPAEGCLSGEFSSDYKGLKPQFKGINFCVFANVKGFFVIKYFSFYYDFSNNISRLWNKIPELSYKPKTVNLDKPISVEIADQDIEQVKKLLSKYQPKNMLIDVRENYGGDVFPTLMSVFAKKPFSLLKRQVVFSNYMKGHSDFFKNL